MRFETRLGHDVLALPGVVPPAGGCVLVVGEGAVLHFPPDVLVVERAWGEPVGELKQFDRVVVLAGHTCPDAAEMVRQAASLVRADGLLVMVVARPYPWGVRGTVWWHGVPMRRWVRLLKTHHWVVVERVTVGFESALWRRILPWTGAVGVIVAQRRVGGLRVIEKPLVPLDVVLKKAVPGACSTYD